jgi:hypothetical protein
VRDAAVIFEVRHRPGEPDDKVEIGRSASKEPGGDAPHGRIRRRVLGRGRAREQRAGKGMRERVHRQRFRIRERLFRASEHRQSFTVQPAARRAQFLLVSISTPLECRR